MAFSHRHAARAGRRLDRRVDHRYVLREDEPERHDHGCALQGPVGRGRHRGGPVLPGHRVADAEGRGLRAHRDRPDARRGGTQGRPESAHRLVLRAGRHRSDRRHGLHHRLLHRLDVPPGHHHRSGVGHRSRHQRHPGPRGRHGGDRPAGHRHRARDAHQLLARRHLRHRRRRAVHALDGRHRRRDRRLRSRHRQRRWYRRDGRSAR